MKKKPIKKMKKSIEKKSKKNMAYYKHVNLIDFPTGRNYTAKKCYLKIYNQTVIYQDEAYFKKIKKIYFHPRKAWHTIN